MEKEFGKLLHYILEFMLDSGRDERTLFEENLREKLDSLKHQNILEEFLLFCERACGDEEIFNAVLLFVAWKTGDNIFINRWQKSFLQFMKEKKDFWGYFKLSEQKILHAFYSGMKSGQMEEWEQSDYLVREMQQILHMDYDPILPEERDQDLIIISATQLLNDNHAPTRIVLELCRIIETYLHKNVFLLCEFLVPDILWLQEAGMKPNWIYVSSYNETLTGQFIRTYKGRDYHGYQILLNEKNVGEMKQLMQVFYRNKPYCVWCIGGMPVFSGAMKQFTTILHTQCTNGYPGIVADMVVNYFEQAEELYPSEKSFLLEHGVAVRDIKLGMPSYKKSEGKWARSDIRIPQDAFVIAIMGTRLNLDCTDDFLEMLNHTSKISSEKNIYFIFIGNTKACFEDKVVSYLGSAERIRFLGHQKEFAEAVALADILVATPGLGNGGAGTTALLEGKPAISLKVGDVASVVGEDFQCESLGDYPALVKRYIEDREFYDSQSRKAQKRIEGLLVSDEELAAQIEEILSDIKDV